MILSQGDLGVTAQKGKKKKNIFIFEFKGFKKLKYNIHKMQFIYVYTRETQF